MRKLNLVIRNILPTIRQVTAEVAEYVPAQIPVAGRLRPVFKLRVGEITPLHILNACTITKSICIYLILHQEGCCCLRILV
jgi:hypothetical protein